MSETTVSFRTDHTVHVAHNRREKETVKNESHIDPNGVCEKWIDIDERQAYDELFGDAVAEYNKKQKRKDRRISDYYEAVQSDKRGRKNKRTKENSKHTSYEVIIAIGSVQYINGEQPHLIDDATGKEIMRQYVSEWDKRNPNLFLYGAYYHADEEGVPHAHLDFIPVADGYKQGMERQSSIGRALKQQGYDDGGSWQENAYTLWQSAERDRLEQICKSKGFSIVHPCKDKDVEHLELKAYKAIQDAKDEVSIIHEQAEMRIQAISKRERDAEAAISRRRKKVDEDAEKNALDELRIAQKEAVLSAKIELVETAATSYAEVESELKETVEKLKQQKPLDLIIDFLKAKRGYQVGASGFVIAVEILSKMKNGFNEWLDKKAEPRKMPDLSRIEDNTGRVDRQKEFPN